MLKYGSFWVCEWGFSFWGSLDKSEQQNFMIKQEESGAFLNLSRSKKEKIILQKKNIEQNTG